MVYGNREKACVYGRGINNERSKQLLSDSVCDYQQQKNSKNDA
jgi:hypothetical protein